jgi:hypothetical protein
MKNISGHKGGKGSGLKGKVFVGLKGSFNSSKLEVYSGGFLYYPVSCIVVLAATINCDANHCQSGDPSFYKGSTVP